LPPQCQMAKMTHPQRQCHSNVKWQRWHLHRDNATATKAMLNCKGHSISVRQRHGKVVIISAKTVAPASLQRQCHGVSVKMASSPQRQHRGISGCKDG
jgi:hypothetical protein